MMSSAAAISSGTWFYRPNLSCKTGFSAGLHSVPRKNIPLISNLSPIEKVVNRNFRAFESPLLGRVSANAVTLKVESDYEVAAPTQILNTDAFVSSLEELVSYPEASSGEETTTSQRHPKRLTTNAAQMKRTVNFPVIRYPLGTEAAIKAMLECNTLVFVVDKRADKKNIRDAVRTMFKIRAKKVNTSITPDGTKKAFIMLAPEFKASDVAKKIGIL